MSWDEFREGLISLFSGQYKILAGFILAILVVYLPAWMLYLHRRKQKAEDFIYQLDMQGISKSLDSYFRNSLRIGIFKQFKTRARSVAEVRIDHSRMGDMLIVHCVDGEEPVFFSRGTQMFFYLTPGRHTLSLAYHWAKSSIAAKLGAPVFAHENFNAKNVDLSVEVKPCQKYRIRYDHNMRDYQFEEEGIFVIPGPNKIFSS